MEDFPEHWKNTLMGWDFWKDAQEYQEHLDSALNSNNEKLDTSLHKRFPFNLGSEKGPRAREEDEKQESQRHIGSISPSHYAETSISNIFPRHYSKLNMPDSKGVPSLRRNKSVTTVTSRIRGGLNLIRRARSPSPTKPAEPWRPQTPGQQSSKDEPVVSYSWRELSNTLGKSDKQEKDLSFPCWTFDHSVSQINNDPGSNERSLPNTPILRGQIAPLSPALNPTPLPSPSKSRPRPLGRDITAAVSLRALKRALSDERLGKDPDYPSWDVIQNDPNLRRDKRGSHHGDPGWVITKSTSRLDLLAGMIDNHPSPDIPLVAATSSSSPGFELSPLHNPPPLSRSPGPRLACPEQLNSSRAPEIGTPGEPLLEFHGGNDWSSLPRTKKTLGLDLFWPCPIDSRRSGYDCLDLAELKPLCEFRNLRSLKIVGMMQSYQSYIWQTAWLNPDLDELELGMALEPDIVNRIYEPRWKTIDEGWSLDPRMGGTPVYSGNRGDGELSIDIGYGEYLDKSSIEKAKIRAMSMGRTPRRLSIRKITLSGFVVDADPFIQWFDTEKLRCINFKGRCIDGGFWLPLSMKTVTVRFPRKIDYQPVPIGILEIDVKRDLNVVELEEGKKVEDTAYLGLMSEEGNQAD